MARAVRQEFWNPVRRQWAFGRRRAVGNCGCRCREHQSQGLLHPLGAMKVSGSETKRNAASAYASNRNLVASLLPSLYRGDRERHHPGHTHARLGVHSHAGPYTGPRGVLPQERPCVNHGRRLLDSGHRFFLGSAEEQAEHRSTAVRGHVELAGSEGVRCRTREGRASSARKRPWDPHDRRRNRPGSARLCRSLLRWRHDRGRKILERANTVSIEKTPIAIARNLVEKLLPYYNVELCRSIGSTA